MFFQVVVEHCEDLRYKDGNGNPIVGHALGKLRRFGDCLHAG
jgi:hypothetical protein